MKSFLPKGLTLVERNVSYLISACLPSLDGSYLLLCADGNIAINIGDIAAVSCEKGELIGGIVSNVMRNKELTKGYPYFRPSKKGIAMMRVEEPEDGPYFVNFERIRE